VTNNLSSQPCFIVLVRVTDGLVDDEVAWSSRQFTVHRVHCFANLSDRRNRAFRRSVTCVSVARYFHVGWTRLLQLSVTSTQGQATTATEGTTLRKLFYENKNAGRVSPKPFPPFLVLCAVPEWSPILEGARPREPRCDVAQVALPLPTKLLLERTERLFVNFSRGRENRQVCGKSVPAVAASVL
jgi:hypothetical protein